MGTARVRFPSTTDVAAELRDAKRYCSAEHNDNEVEVRLQVAGGGCWWVRSGDPCYDTDHTGYWGTGTVTPRTNCRELARDLIDQAKDQHAQESQTMKLQVTLTVDVGWCDQPLGEVRPGDPLAERIEAAVAQAVANAMKYGEMEGHRHAMENDISILMDSPVVAKLVS